MTTLYDSIYAYAQDADITHYRHSNVDKDAPACLVEAFQPADDHDFAILDKDRLTEDGKTYFRVYWGEYEISYLLENALFDVCYVRYCFVPDDHSGGEYVSDGIVYETLEAAERVSIIENLTDSQYYCAKCAQVFEYWDIDQHGCEQCNAAIDDDNVAGA